MKQFFILLFLLSAAFTSYSQNIAELEMFEKAMKPGTILTYDVSYKGKQYKFIVTIKKLTPEVSFDWQMTDPVNKSGSVTITADALKNANALNNLFSGGPLTLDKETTVWLSKKVYDDVGKNAEASIKVNGSTDTLTVMGNTIGEFGFTLNGTFVTVPGYDLQGGGDPKYTIDVIESDKFPVIHRMDLGWTIMLTDVKSQ